MYDRDKPSPIQPRTLASDNNSLKQKASQMYCLSKFLPLMVGALVPDDNEHWKLFCLLLDIVDIVFANITSVNAIGVLEGLIEEHHSTFLRIYPGRSIIPKMHYMVHYPSHMMRFGPMKRTWCMRFEAKHRYFKRLASFIGNYKNVAYTMATRHQGQQCYYSNVNKEGSSSFLQRPTSIVVAQRTDYYADLQAKEGNILTVDTFYESQKVTINGTDYMVGAIVVTGYLREQEAPEFGLITKIISLPNKSYFQLKKYVAVQFSYHFHAFEVIAGEEPPTLVTSEDLFIHTPMHLVHPISAEGRNAAFYVVIPYSMSIHT
ncbi:uncharacterized protein LOC114536220 [Dendronephthya gigantea]|uniref:uncharacterized protein LOC114536220 n=1 Tax=Dendronephthya gigantea TaxID=151771 RepID=UPI001069959C|nr:uncharacterized protein LOC114536220 [Dendronephthya gigantea]